MHATGAIFQDFLALCPYEPRLPRGEMQAVPCGTRSKTRPLPVFTSQSPPAGIRSVRKYKTGYVFCSSKNGPYIRTRLVIPQEKISTPGQPRPQMLSLLLRRATARAVGECRPVYPCMHPCSRTHVEIRGRNGPGRRPPRKKTTNPIHMRTAATAVCCCYCCCCAAAPEVNLVRAVAAAAAVLLLLRLIECIGPFFYEQNNEEQKN